MASFLVRTREPPNALPRDGRCEQVDFPLFILSFGEDEQGDVYFMTTTVSGRGIFRFVQAEKK